MSTPSTGTDYTDQYQSGQLTHDGNLKLELSVPGMHCGGCVKKVEDVLSKLPEVIAARANLTTRRITVRWKPCKNPSFIQALNRAGFTSSQVMTEPEHNKQEQQALIRSLAVAGFGAANIMLFSVSVWAGVDAQTRTVFHLLSALIALLVLAYSGQIFFRSAYRALRGGITNMDVPISVGILLAFVMSVYDAVTGGEHVYFDASITLVFFLLIGRTLDFTMRSRVRNAVHGMANLIPRGVMRQDPNTAQFFYTAIADVNPGDCLSVKPNERIAVDSRVKIGQSDVDRSLVTGEALPYGVAPGTFLAAGTQNLTHPLIVTAVSHAHESFLSQVVKAMQAAENGRLRYRKLADRLASWYAPFVHAAALVGFLLWFALGAGVHQSLSIAVAVLIITCPCALGLAVPMVQVIAARILFERGVLIKDGSALERLARVDVAVFDKTGTLTSGQPRSHCAADVCHSHRQIAASMALHSRHPYSRAILADTPLNSRVEFDEIIEVPGFGIQAQLGKETYRLGNPQWGEGKTAQDSIHGGVALFNQTGELARFHLEDPIRSEASDALAQLRDQGIDVQLVSGDTTGRVHAVASKLAITHWQAQAQPADKVARFESLKNSGHRALMVGDGLNDVPALATAFVSMAPETAAELGRSASDIVYLRGQLDAVPFAIKIARRADHLVKQNMRLALAYNAIALPLALAGLVTPLVAAVAMSASSALVVLNAFRLHSQASNDLAQKKSSSAKSNSQQSELEMP